MNAICLGCGQLISSAQVVCECGSTEATTQETIVRAVTKFLHELRSQKELPPTVSLKNPKLEENGRFTAELTISGIGVDEMLGEAFHSNLLPEGQKLIVGGSDFVVEDDGQDE